MGIRDRFSKYFDDDRLSSRRFVDKEDEHGFTIHEAVEHLISLPCHLTFRKVDTGISSDEVVNTLHTVNVIHCNSDIDIIKGDEIEIIRNCGAIYSGVAGNPNKMRSGRQSFILEEVGRA